MSKPKNNTDRSVLLRLIRAKMKGRPTNDLTTGAGIAYSRAHDLVNGPEDSHRFRNLEAALSFLSPGLWKRIEAEAVKAEAQAEKDQA